MSQYFVSTALLRYGALPYSAVFCTAVAVYGTVVSPNADDINFAEESHSESGSESSSTGSDNDIEEITNEEARHPL